ncbi:MAG: polysaccharide biosynthesis protein [Acidimicrobiales bacterium]|nr:polysaccharide biosynthesis protein [Acidimicrobiales bacterium]
MPPDPPLRPAQLLLLDRDESALHDVRLSIEGRALLDTPDLLLCDIRDRDRVLEVFRQRRPEVVFHAAALKHLPLLEQYPDEAWKTNVVATQTLLDASVAVGVRRFVNISTDKAADPISVLGHSKRIAERLTAHAADVTDHPYLSVRFGNVLGSRGSMLPLFRTQIDNGGPVTVTHPDVTRYFMTVEEAVSLVIRPAPSAGRASRWCSTWASRCVSPRWPSSWWPRRPARSRSCSPVSGRARAPRGAAEAGEARRPAVPQRHQPRARAAPRTRRARRWRFGPRPPAGAVGRSGVRARRARLRGRRPDRRAPVWARRLAVGHDRGTRSPAPPGGHR